MYLVGNVILYISIIPLNDSFKDNRCIGRRYLTLLKDQVDTYIAILLKTRYIKEVRGRMGRWIDAY